MLVKVLPQQHSQLRRARHDPNLVDSPMLQLTGGSRRVPDSLHDLPADGADELRYSQDPCRQHGLFAQRHAVAGDSALRRWPAPGRPPSFWPASSGMVGQLPERRTQG